MAEKAMWLSCASFGYKEYHSFTLKFTIHVG